MPSIMDTHATGALLRVEMAASAIDKISGSAHSLENDAFLWHNTCHISPAGYSRVNLSHYSYNSKNRCIGAFAAILLPGWRYCYHLQHGQNIIFLAAVEALIWIAALIRFLYLW